MKKVPGQVLGPGWSVVPSGTPAVKPISSLLLFVCLLVCWGVLCGARGSASENEQQRRGKPEHREPGARAAAVRVCA